MGESEAARRYGRDPRVATRGGEGGEASSFRTAYPRTYGRPDRDRLKSAFWAYVQGHDRGWEAERKRRDADAAVGAEGLERRRSRALAGSRGPPEAGPTPSGVAAGTADRPSAPTTTARFGVPVPERLDFHRGPDTWRRRLGRREAEEG